jgi:hypothetical protein
LSVTVLRLFGNLRSVALQCDLFVSFAAAGKRIFQKQGFASSAPNLSPVIAAAFLRWLEQVERFERSLRKSGISRR